MLILGFPGVLWTYFTKRVGVKLFKANFIHCLNIAKIPLTKRGAYQRIEKDVDVPYKKGRIQKHEFATHFNGILANNLTTFQTFPYITQMFSMWCPLQASTLP